MFSLMTIGIYISIYNVLCTTMNIVINSYSDTLKYKLFYLKMIYNDSITI